MPALAGCRTAWLPLITASASNAIQAGTDCLQQPVESKFKWCLWLWSTALAYASAPHDAIARVRGRKTARA
eukprot:3990360-Heterocapsa_arctica.AAC.1